MKKLLFGTLLLLSGITLAQNNLKKIASDAELVFSIHGKNILKKVPENSISTSPFFSLMLKEFFGRSSDVQIADLGFDLSGNFSVVMENSENLSSNYILYPLKNKSAFEKVVVKRWGEKEKIKGKGYEGYRTSSYSQSYVVWNKNLAVFIKSSVKGASTYSYYDYDYYLNDMLQNEVLAAYLKSGDLIKEYDKVQKKYEKLKLERAKLNSWERDKIDFDKVVSYDYEDYYDRKAEVRDYFDFRQQEEREKLKKKLEEQEKELVSERLENFFSKKGHPNPITENSDFMNDRDQNADGIMWSKSGLMFPLLAGRRYSKYGYYNSNVAGADNGVLANMYFDEKQARANVKIQYGDSIKKYANKVLSTKLDSKLHNYIDKNALGFYSLSFNMEEALKTISFVYETSLPEINKRMEDHIGFYTSLFRILLDEKEAAEILKGDAVMVLLGIEDKEVTYQTYEMDEDYNYKEVTKTKKEPLPKFRVALSSDKEELFERLMRMAVAEKMFTKEKGFYTSVESKNKYRRNDFPFKIHVKYENGVILVSTEISDMKGVKGSLSSEHSEMIKNNSVVMYYNNQKLFDQFPMENIRNKKERKLFNYFKNNSRDAIYTIKNNNGVVEGELKVNIPEGEKNSADYFLKLFNELAEIGQGNR